jgi:hypothetical protein
VKVLVGANSNPSTWYKSNAPEEIELMAVGLVSQGVLGLSAKQIEKVRNSPNFEITLRSMGCLALVSGQEVCDVSQDGQGSLPMLVRTEKFQEFKKLRCSEPGVEKSEELFHRKFQKLSQVSKQIEFVDQHFWANLSDPDRGAYFLIEKLLQVSPAKIRIYSSVADRKSDNEAAKTNLAELCESFGRKNSVEVYLYRKFTGKKFIHDRLGRLLLEHGSIGFTLGHGSELFGSSKTKVGEIFTEVKMVFDTVTAHLRSVDSNPEFISF